MTGLISDQGNFIEYSKARKSVLEPTNTLNKNYKASTLPNNLGGI